MMNDRHSCEGIELVLYRMLLNKLCVVRSRLLRHVRLGEGDRQGDDGYRAVHVGGGFWHSLSLVVTNFGCP